ncbi:hypothetical protein CO180_01615 [candidate division WWE3 bacterium CG_4_9_14_3_um_filter_41_6]|uniref:Peptidase M50 domain-containing protein n=1 Tax=candidate division WWE3 bacterium CG_4_10_14_0_2_um_filter_41_14 TaxID=1975072 RepID=A0A2M7TEH2_UNCKA|nr:MAG: hypothetical protein COY32_07185 [candidate division WWE3 bacterium CG_4_10_14_0_2_um_filter_41_14]PJA39089.1 MAG: hypothetical protein CO180_01615 [candidate division WWE3 bacterium CG_4_9_14_3_um_filter_41_6]
MTMIITSLLVLSFIIIVHEFGHLVAAKLTGMKVEEFALGLGPKLITLYNDGETTYVVNMLPIGGYVKIYGENAIPTEQTERSFGQKPVWARAIVLAAGIFMNYVLALFLIGGLLTFAGEPVTTITLPITSVSETSPFIEQGITSNAIITGYLDDQGNKKQITNSAEFIEFIKDHAGTNVTVTMLKDGDSIISPETLVTIVPRISPPEGEGALGIGIQESYTVSYQDVAALSIVPRTFSVTHSLLGAMTKGLGDMVSNLFTKGTVPSDIAGPVGIAKLTGEAAKQGLASLTQFMALISLNLAVINLIPFPALDGGRLFFLVIEFVTRKKVPANIEGWIHVIGLFILLGLVAVISFFDIKRFF